MVFLIYQDYAESVQSNNRNTTTLQASSPIPEVCETKELPPPYIAPTSAAILSHTINV